MLNVTIIPNRNMTLADRLILRLIQTHLCSITEIKNVLCIFSDEIIAQAIMSLNNNNFIVIDSDNRTLELSYEFKKMCDVFRKDNTQKNKSLYTDGFKSIAKMSDLPYIISDKKQKSMIISKIFPEIDAGKMLKYIDFKIEERTI